MNKQKTKQVNLDAGLPDLSKWVIFSITFGFLTPKLSNEPDFPVDRGQPE